MFKGDESGIDHGVHLVFEPCDEGDDPQRLDQAAHEQFGVLSNDNAWVPAEVPGDLGNDVFDLHDALAPYRVALLSENESTTTSQRGSGRSGEPRRNDVRA